MGNLIAILTFLCAIMIPVAVVLFNDLDRGLKLDRHLIITRIIKLPQFVVASVIMAGILLAISFIDPDLENNLIVRWPVLIIPVVTYFILIFCIMMSAISWLASDDFSSYSRSSYKERRRLKYLTSGKLARTTIAWHEFWLNPQTYDYLGSAHIYPYIQAFLQHLSTIKYQDYHCAEELSQDFSIAMLHLCKIDDAFLGTKLFPDLLRYFEQSCIAGDYQQGIWANLIRQYLGMFFFQEEKSYHECFNGKYTEDDPFVPLIGYWRMAWEACLTSGDKITDASAIRQLATVICDSYLASYARSCDEEIQYLRSCELISSGESKRLYNKLIKSLATKNSAVLAEYLISRAGHVKTHPNEDDFN